MDELSRKYRVLYVEQKEIVKERLIATVGDSLDSLSEVVCGQLQSIAESYPHVNALTRTQANQQLMQAQNVIQEAGRVYGQQLASTLTQGFNSLNILPVAAGSIASNQPSADISISIASTQVNTSTNQINDTNEGSDDDEMSVKSEINSEDECLSDSDSQPEVDVKEEPDETQTETAINQINQTDDTATVKDEIVSSSECESDSDIDDYESDSMIVKGEDQEEEEIRFVRNSHNQVFVAIGSSFEESENNAQSDGNVETINSNEANNEHQSVGMLMDDEGNFDDESQDEPTITVVNFEEEFQAQFMDNSHNQRSVLDGSLDEESENVPQEEGSGNIVDFHMMDSNEDDNQHSSGQEVLNDQETSTEASNQLDPAGFPIVANTASTLTRRPTPAMGNSVNDLQQGTLTGSRKRKDSNGRSEKSTSHKRSRVVPAPTVAVEEAGDSQEGGDPEPEAISSNILVRHLKCHVPGCPKMFPGKEELNGHHLTKHAIEKYTCKVKDCTESYANSAELTTHRNSAHDNLDNVWPCGQCELTCTTYGDLCTHTYYYHEPGLFACTKCDYTDETRARVRIHQRTSRPDKHHQKTHRPAKHQQQTSRPATHYCTYAGCSSSFKQKSKLNRHLRTHTKEKPFLCSQCFKAFAHKNYLIRHERIHSGLKPYSCTWPHCDYSSSQRTDVIVHVRTVHFHLPRSKTEQTKRGIIDDRDARVFVKTTSRH